ncbi:MAG: hypothetical protein HY727_20315 [Candidatus Rokubacteria bacterium]|nr:hypothetical protein [Candidatus Rokubacteria bacterium]
MGPARRSVLREGVVAGLIGAATVALWFLIYDAWRGQPLFTPALLGTAIFYGVSSPASVQIAAGPVIGYTIVHVFAFIGFGIVAACMMVASELEPAIFVAFVTLFGVFEVFFFVALRTLSHEMLGALGWWAILAGNFLAALGMLWFLVRGHPELPSALVGSSGPVLREGIVAGVIGAAAVAFWFLILDAIGGDALRTPRFLGTAMLGQDDPVGAILSYTIVHGIVFILFGIAGAFLLSGAEARPVFLFPFVMLYVAFEFFFFAVVLILARWVLDELAGWAVVVGNLLAGSAMLTYYFRRHRTLAGRVAQALAEEP